MTRHVSDADFRKDLTRHLAKAREGGRVHVKGPGGKAILMSEQEYEGWKETVYLLQKPRNAAKLRRALEQDKAGALKEHELIEE
jgi:antitoxin YefM